MNNFHLVFLGLVTAFSLSPAPLCISPPQALSVHEKPHRLHLSPKPSPNKFLPVLLSSQPLIPLRAIDSLQMLTHTHSFRFFFTCCGDPKAKAIETNFTRCGPPTRGEETKEINKGGNIFSLSKYALPKWEAVQDFS